MTEAGPQLAGIIAARGFWDDPVQAWLHPVADPRRMEKMTATFSMLADRFALRGRIDFDGEDAVAMWMPPDPPDVETSAPPAEVLALFDDSFAERVATLVGSMEAHHPEEPHWYLGVVATVPERQGTGIGGRLLRPVLDRCDREGIPSYLESSNPRNLSFYYRLGYEQTGEIRLPDGPSLFPMWRKPAAG